MCGVASHANIAFSLQTFHFFKITIWPQRDKLLLSVFRFSIQGPKDLSLWPGRRAAGNAGASPRAGLQPEALSQAPKGQSSFSLTPILSVASVVLSPAWLYYKRKELIALVDKPKPAQRSETQQNTQGRLHILCYGWSSPCEVKIISAFLLCNHPISS